MRAYALGAVPAAFLIIPTSAFSAQIEVGPGGIRVGPGYHHHMYNYGGEADVQNCGRPASTSKSSGNREWATAAGTARFATEGDAKKGLQGTRRVRHNLAGPLYAHR
jgi:hypothetical protein